MVTPVLYPPAPLDICAVPVLPATLKDFDQEWKQVHTAKVEAKVKKSKHSKKLVKLAKPKKQAKGENVQVFDLFDFLPKDEDKKSKKDDKETDQLSLF